MAEKDKKCYCGREIYDDYNCIFHSRKLNKNATLFQKELDEIFRDESLNIYDFSHFIFPGQIYFPESINKVIVLNSAIFQEDLPFRPTSFQQNAYFEWASFKGYANFGEKIFQKGAYFDGAVFERATRFYKSSFKDVVSFNSATFENILIINQAESNKIFSEKEVDFRGVKFLKPEKVIFRKVNLSKFRFLETDLRKVEFVDVDWDMKTGRSRVYDAIELDPVTKKFDYPLIAQLYKRLRANYEENLNYAQAGDFHIGEMEMYRKGKGEPIDRGITWLYKVLSNYGESYRRPLVWIALLLLLFPLLYMFAGITPKIGGSQIQYYLDLSFKGILPNLEKLKDFWSSFIYSLSVFSLIRERPYQTISDLGHFFTILESIFSPVLIAFFLLALRRRFKR